jgi:hypothetical protein
MCVAHRSDVLFSRQQHAALTWRILWCPQWILVISNKIHAYRAHNPMILWHNGPCAHPDFVLKFDNCCLTMVIPFYIFLILFLYHFDVVYVRSEQWQKCLKSNEEPSATIFILKPLLVHDQWRSSALRPWSAMQGSLGCGGESPPAPARPQAAKLRLRPQAVRAGAPGERREAAILWLQLVA